MVCVIFVVLMVDAISIKAENQKMINTNEKDKRGYCVVALNNPKYQCNVGAVLRAAHTLHANMVVLKNARFKDTKEDTTKAYNHIPILRTSDLQTMIPYNCIPIAVDLVEGATNIMDFIHPERGYYIFGAEDGTLGKSITSWCKHKIVVPTKHCMNLGVAVSIVLYDRMLKQHQQTKYINDNTNIDKDLIRILRTHNSSLSFQELEGELKKTNIQIPNTKLFIRKRIHNLIEDGVFKLTSDSKVLLNSI